MNFEIRYAAKADADLQGQLLWLKERSPQVATTWLNGIIQAVDSLRKAPDSVLVGHIGFSTSSKAGKCLS